MTQEQLREKALLLRDKLRAGEHAATAVTILSRSLVAESKLDDTDLLAMKSLYPEWAAGNTLRLGDVVQHHGKLYRVTQPHTAQLDWAPDRAINLFTVVQESSSDGPLPWVAGEQVYAGDLRVYNGQTYECLLEHVTQTGWEPSGLPALWKKI